MMKKLLLILLMIIPSLSFAQGLMERSVTATDYLSTQNKLYYQSTDIPVLDLTYHQFSSDSINWHKAYVAGDKYMRLSNDTKTSWFTLDIQGRTDTYVTSAKYYANGDLTLYRNDGDSVKVSLGGGYVSYADSITTFVTPTQLTDSLNQFRGTYVRTINAIAPASNGNVTLTTDDVPEGTAKYFYTSANYSPTGRWNFLGDTTIAQVVKSNSNETYYTDYNLGQAPSRKTGRVYYDTIEHALSVYNDITGETHNLGREAYIRAWNETGTTIPNGSVVYINGATTQHPTVALADGSKFDESRIIGLTTVDIPTGSEADVTFRGRVKDVNTSAFSAGDVLYLSPTTPGALTNVRPTNGDYPNQVGFCITSNATTGIILVELQTSEHTAEANRLSGFPDYSDAYTTITIDNTNRYFKISPVGSSFYYYDEGAKYIKTGTDSLLFANTEGRHYIYYQDSTLIDGVNLTRSQIIDVIHNDTPVAGFYWDATNGQAIGTENSRYAFGMPAYTTSYLRTFFGVQYLNGLTPTNLTVDGAGSLNSDAQFGIDAGIIWNEDIQTSIATVASTTGMPVYYRSGTNGDWRKQVVPGYSFIYGTYAKWNEYTGTTWQMTEAASGSFILVHIFVMPSTNGYPQLVSVAGQHVYTAIADARAAASTAIYDLSFGNAPITSIKPVGTFILETKSNFSNTPHSRYVSFSPTEDYVDFREASLIGGGNTGINTSSFLSHDDTPSTYTGYNDSAVYVNSAADGLVFKRPAYLRDTSNIAYLDQYNTFTKNINTTGVYQVNGTQLTTNDIPESGNLYYTDPRVSANADVSANTASRHNPVTLGTANGLSLSTQILSLGLASSTTNGALSSTDWSTFNGKQAYLGGTGIVKSSAGTISYLTDNSSNWNTAYGWGDWSIGVPSATMTFTNKSGNISQWTNDSGYLTSFTETDPVWTSEKSNYYTKTESDGRYVPLTRTVAGKALSTDITLASSDLTDTYNIARLNVNNPFSSAQTIQGAGTTWLYINNTNTTPGNSSLYLNNVTRKWTITNRAAASSILQILDETSTTIVRTEWDGSGNLKQYGNINTTGVYQTNGTQISSSDLSDGSNLAKLNADNTFTSSQNIQNGNGANLSIYNNSSGSGYYTAIKFFGLNSTTPTEVASINAYQDLNSQNGEFKIYHQKAGIKTLAYNIDYNGNSNTYGNINTTGQYQVNGTQIASSNLSDGSSLVKFTSAQTISYSTTPTQNFNSGYNATITLTGNVTTYTLTNVPDGGQGDIVVVQNATGGYGISAFAASGLTVKYINGTSPTASNINSSSNGVSVVSYHRVGTYLLITYGGF